MPIFTRALGAQMDNFLSNLPLLNDAEVEMLALAAEEENPILLFCPDLLKAQAKLFLDCFNGTVAFATKANPSPDIIKKLFEAGLKTFDVASINEIELVQHNCPTAELHYNNPIRSKREISIAYEKGIRSFSVDRLSELNKLRQCVEPTHTTLSIRFKLDLESGEYNFGSKFGASIEEAKQLIKQAEQQGFKIAIAFNVGTQCNSPNPWIEYLKAAHQLMEETGTHKVEWINIGGGFPSYRTLEKPQTKQILEAIEKTVRTLFKNPPRLICEPGRSLVADAFSLITTIKAIPSDNHLFLNDGIYGTLSELLLVGIANRIEAFSPKGQKRKDEVQEMVIFGPTCDSVDVLPAALNIPKDIATEDYLIFHGLGAYSTSTCTRFNGYGNYQIINVKNFNFS